MSNNESTKPGETEKPVSEYAPKGQAEQRPADTGPKKLGVYVTGTMIAPAGDVKNSDPIRLTQITGPAIDHIGKSTADQVDLVALSIVENARSGAETILAEAKVQAADMIQGAEDMAAEMRLFARAIRAHTERKALQVNTFCANAESILATMHGLGANFHEMIAADDAAEKEGKEEPLELPKWVKRERTPNT